MIEKDYLIRYLNALFEALQRIKNNIESSSSTNDELKYTYTLLGGSLDFFLEKGISDLIEHFEKKNREYLESMNYLSETLYFDGLTQKDITIKRQILLKSKELNDFYRNNTTSFNFSVINLGRDIEEELKKLEID